MKKGVDFPGRVWYYSQALEGNGKNESEAKRPKGQERSRFERFPEESEKRKSELR